MFTSALYACLALLGAQSLVSANVPASYDGCINANQASIVLPSLSTANMKLAFENILKQFPATFFANEEHFADANAVQLLKSIQATNVHIIGYQFSPDTSKAASSIGHDRINLELDNAKQMFSSVLKEDLVYVLVPKQGGERIAKAIQAKGLYPVMPNANDDSVGQPQLKALITSKKGIVMSVNPLNAVNQLAYAQNLEDNGYAIDPLSSCLPVIQHKDNNSNNVFTETEVVDDVDLAPEMGNSVAAGEPEQEAGKNQSGIQWGFIAIGAVVIAGIVLAVYFYRNQA